MRVRWIIAAVSIAGILVLGTWWPFPSYDRANVHPSLRALPTPYRSIRVEYYLDGGSIGVEVVGADGTIRQFSLPVDISGGRSTYPRLFVGGMHIDQKTGSTGLTEITNTAATKAMLIRLIDAEASDGAGRCLALLSLRRAPKDIVTWMVYVAWGRHFSQGR